MTIININGNPYTSASEDMKIMKLQKQMRQAIQEGMRDLKKGRDGLWEFNMGAIDEIIAQAYYLGRDK
jgi:hypothetical protein